MCVSLQCSREGRFRFRWKTVPAVPVPPSVSGKTVPTVPVSGSGAVPEPPLIVKTSEFARGVCKNQGFY